jgi:hypothetical protein
MMCAIGTWQPPTGPGDVRPSDAIAALLNCAEACTGSADEYLRRPDPTLHLTSARTVLDCADTCAATVRALTRPGGFDDGLMAALLRACRAGCLAAASTAQSCRVAASIAAEACQRLLVRLAP